MGVGTPTAGRGPKGGVWRTIRGAKVYLAPGQTPAQAFAASGRGAAARASASRPANASAAPAKAAGRARYEGRLVFKGTQDDPEAFLRRQCAKAGLDAEEVVASCVPDAKLVPYAEMRWDDRTGDLTIEGGGPGVTMERRVNLARMTVYNEFFRVADTSKGTGTDLFARQVENASRAGFVKMETHAARAQGMNGYYTWPRLGYDHRLPPQMWAGPSKPPVPEKSYLSDLMKTPEGRSWWKENGISVDVVFDLTPGSQSRRVLEAYVAAKKGMA